MAPRRPESDDTKSFRSLLGRDLRSVETRTVNRDFAVREAKEGLAALERLQSFERFFDQARIEDPRSGKTSITFESEVRDQANRAAQDTDIVVGTMLTVMRHLRSSGSLDAALGAFGRALEKSGPQDAEQLFESVLPTEAGDASRDIPLWPTKDAPLWPTNLMRVSDILGEQKPTISVRSGRLNVEIASGGDVAIRLPGDERPQSINDVLNAHRFEASVATFAQSGQLLVDFVPTTTEGSTVTEIDDLLLFAASHVQSRMRRHAKRVDQIGLAAYQGEDPGPLLGFVGLIATAIGALGFFICCPLEAEGLAECCAEMVALFIFGLICLGILSYAEKAGSAQAVTTYGNPSPP